MNTLDKELATYREHFQELLDHEGKYVLIRGDEIIGLYGSRDEALNVGYQRFGFPPFLVKKIALKEEVATILTPFVIETKCQV